jgi:hypothetical protein
MSAQLPSESTPKGFPRGDFVCGTVFLSGVSRPEPVPFHPKKPSSGGVRSGVFPLKFTFSASAVKVRLKHFG